MGEICKVEYGDKLYEQVLALRQKLLRDPLKMIFTDIELERDKGMQYFAYLAEDEMQGVVGLEVMEKGIGQLRQMAVSDKLQGQGIGRQLVAYLENQAREMGLQEIHLDARLVAKGFYARLGYVEYGEIYEKIGILHVDMQKLL